MTTTFVVFIPKWSGDARDAEFDTLDAARIGALQLEREYDVRTVIREEQRWDEKDPNGGADWHVCRSRAVKGWR